LARNLSQDDASVWTADFRNHCRGGAGVDRQVESKNTQHSARAIGVGMFDAELDQRRTFRRRQRGMWRRSPVNKERYDSAGNYTAQVGQLPSKLRAIRSLPAAGLYGAEINAMLRSRIPNFMGPAAVCGPCDKARGTCFIQTEWTTSRNRPLLRIRCDDLEV